MVVNAENLARPVTTASTGGDRAATASALTVGLPTAADTVKAIAPAETETRIAALVQPTSNIRYQAELLNSRAASLNREVLVALMHERTAVFEKLNAQTLLELLGKSGMSWSAVARMLAVSAPALRKWRLGEGTTPANRKALARVAAVVELLSEQFMIQDAASWLEIPLADTKYTIIDAFARGRADLLFDYARLWVTSEQVLDALDKEWRKAHRPKEFEAFMAADGKRALRRVRR